VLAGVIWGITSGYMKGTYDLVSQRLIEVLTSFLTLGPGDAAIGWTRAGSWDRDRCSRRDASSVGNAGYSVSGAFGQTSTVRGGGALHRRERTSQYGDADRTAMCCAGSGRSEPLSRRGDLRAGGSEFFSGLVCHPQRPVRATCRAASWRNHSSSRGGWLFPGATIALTVLGANMLGDALRDYLDPRLTSRQRRVASSPTRTIETHAEPDAPAVTSVHLTPT
jgi:hypothetical protein